MTGKKLGILGMGRIGRAVAKRARAFDMEIHYHNRNQLDSSLEEGAIYHEDIKELFKNSEFLSINCPGSKDTENLIGESEHALNNVQSQKKQSKKKEKR